MRRSVCDDLAGRIPTGNSVNRNRITHLRHYPLGHPRNLARLDAILLAFAATTHCAGKLAFRGKPGSNNLFAAGSKLGNTVPFSFGSYVNHFQWE